MLQAAKLNSEKSICRFAGILRHIELLYRTISLANTDAASRRKHKRNFESLNEILIRMYGPKKDRIDPSATKFSTLKLGDLQV